MGRMVLASLAAVVSIAATATDTRWVADGRVVTYPAPAGQPLNSSFSVRVRPEGGDWQRLDVYRAVVDKDTLSVAGMVLFDAEGPVEVEVTKASGTIGSARVRPLSYGIAPTIDPGGRTARFTLPRPLNVSFEVDGDVLRNLHVFASPLEADMPQPGPKVISFGPGIHPIPGDHVLRVPSNTTVYIAGGAVVQGSLDIVNVRNVVVRGRGIIDPSPFFEPVSRATIDIRNSTDVGLRDITLLRAQDGSVRIADAARVVVSGIREINADRSSDGIYVNASRNVLVDGVFLRTSDDSLAVYATTPWAGHGSTRNVTLRNSTLWADVAHAFLTGVHGNPNGGDVVEHVELQNVDVLEHDSYLQGDLYQGALAVNAGDRVVVRDVRFDDIRIEDFSRGQVVNLKVFLNPAYNKQPGTRIDRILFRNVRYVGDGDQPSQIRGYDPSRRVTNVTFDGLVRNGRIVLEPAAGNIQVGAHTTNVVFRRQPPTRVVGGGAARIAYSGRWRRVEDAASHGLDLHVPRRSGSAMKATFTGRQARIVGRTGPSAGKVDVHLDGRFVATVDTYSAVTRPQQVWLDTGVLTAGRHTLELRYRRAKNVLSAGAAVGFDGLEIVK
ncbi:MAG TPA: glycosyl hydrolase family 28 protein [Gaiellaceae bacterium]|nr:glycosyl hydrolase family 28 protein [Gaiellaceae bacterium]